MPVFQYIARNPAGKIVSGSTEATNQAVAARNLRERGLVPTSIELGSAGGVRIRGKKARRGRVKLEDLAVFSRQMATMLNAGLTLIEVLDALAEQTEKIQFRNILNKVKQDVAVGASLTEALSRHPRVFSLYFVSMVRAGEAGGMLATVLEQVAHSLEKQCSLRRKVRGALAYPSILFFLAICLAVFLVVMVIPIFQDVYEDLGGRLPWPTLMLVMISDFVRTKWYLALVMIGALVFAGVQWRRSAHGRLQTDRMVLKIPIIGKLLLKAIMARFARTTSSLLRAGVSLLNALEIVAQTTGNALIEQAVRQVRVDIQEGEPLAKSLNEVEVFPPLVVKMVDAGEKTGAIDSMLSKIADFYEDEVDTAVATLTSVIEPIMIVIVGTIVGFVVISMFWPLFVMVTLIK